MSELFVDWCTMEKLPCTNKTLINASTGLPEGYSVTLCLKTDTLLEPFDCFPPTDPETEQPPISYVPAHICQAYTLGDCSPSRWYYTFSYSSDRLANVDIPLQPADIDGVFCNDCMISFFAERLGSEVYLRDDEGGGQTLITQHQCEYPIASGSVTTPWEDYSDSIVITGDGTNTLSAISVNTAMFTFIDKVGWIDVEFGGTLSGVESNVVNITLPFNALGIGLTVNMFSPVGLVTGGTITTSLTDVSIRRYDDTNMINGDYTWRVFGSCHLA